MPEDLLAKLEESESLLRTGVAGHLERVERLLLAIARHAPAPAVASLAMNALTTASGMRRNGKSPEAAEALNEALSRLRWALLDAGKRS